MTKFELVSFNQYEKDGGIKEDYDSIKLPKRATKGSAGYDFFAPYSFSLNPGESIKITSGIRCQMDMDRVLLILPRSSLGFKYSLMLNNTVGVIDADYYNAANEGHIMIKFTNRGDKILTIDKGTAFAQGIFINYFLTDDDETNGIRIGGFGSTNK